MNAIDFRAGVLILAAAGLTAPLAVAQQQAEEQVRQQERAEQKAQDTAQSRQREQVREQERVYGSQLMTQEERNAYRQRMRVAKTMEEREQVRAEHHAAMQVRAKERGVTLPEEPPPMGSGKGRGMGPGGGTGPGMGGGMGPRGPGGR
jgi:type II secretory pathway pseudopilin PulG